MEILQRDKLSRRRSGGLREYRLVMDGRISENPQESGPWQGLGQLVYLADRCLAPHGEAESRGRGGVNTLCLVLSGSFKEEGALHADGPLGPFDVQVLRAGTEGVSRKLVNPDDAECRTVELGLLDAASDDTAISRVFQPQPGRITRVYGGSETSGGVFPGPTCIDIARLHGGQSLDVDKPALVYVCDGKGFANEEIAVAGTLLRSEQLTFDATENACLILVHEEV